MYCTNYASASLNIENNTLTWNLISHILSSSSISSSVSMKLHEIRLAIPAALFASLFFICSAYNNKQIASLKEDHAFMRILLWQVFKVWTSFRKNVLITYSIGQSDHTLERKLVGPIPISICNYLYICIYKYDYWVVSIADSQRLVWYIQFSKSLKYCYAFVFRYKVSILPDPVLSTKYTQYCLLLVAVATKHVNSGYTLYTKIIHQQT